MGYPFAPIPIVMSTPGIFSRKFRSLVIVTSLPAERDRQRGIDAGADAFMVKRDFDQQELLGTVERLIGTESR